MRKHWMQYLEDFWFHSYVVALCFDQHINYTLNHLNTSVSM